MIGSARSSCETTSGGVRIAAATKAMTIANLRFWASPSGVARPALTSRSSTTGSSKARPNAKISLMISDRYSDIRGSISMASEPSDPAISKPMKKFQASGVTM